MWKFLLAAVLAFLSIVIFFPFLLFLDSTYIFIFIVIGAFIVLWIFNNNDEENTNSDNSQRSFNKSINNEEVKKILNADVVKIVKNIEDKRLVKYIDIDNTVTDIDGNVYKTVKIGTQIWMAENLRVSRYRNGDKIQNVVDDQKWQDADNGAWCFYENEAKNNSIYGKLYNWFAVDDNRGLAPKGWHVPSNEEWATLINYLGGENVAGGKLKQTGTEYWNSPNEAATNSSGFSALPGGYRFTDGTFLSLGSNGNWWSSTERNPSYAWGRDMDYYLRNVNWNYNAKQYGFSMRCVRDLY